MHLYSIQRWSLKSPEELWTPRVSAAVIEHNDPAVHQESSLMEGNNRHQQDLFNGCFAYIHFKTMSALVTLFQRLIFLFFLFLVVNKHGFSVCLQSFRLVILRSKKTTFRSEKYLFHLPTRVTSVTPCFSKAGKQFFSRWITSPLLMIRERWFYYSGMIFLVLLCLNVNKIVH